jgi:hypothetical protein
MVDDARVRSKTYLDTYLVAANLTQDDGSTPLVFHCMYTQPEVPFVWLFNGKGNDALFIIGKPESTAITDYDGGIIGYNEKVPITIYTKDKPGVTGTKALWTCEAELRRIVELYWLGSFRSLNRMGDKTQDMGGWTLYGAEYNLTYEREAGDVSTHTTGITLSYGHIFLDDCVDLTSWDTTAGAGFTATVDSESFFAFNLGTSQTKYWSYPAEGGASNLTISSSVYPKIKFQYKCSNANVKAKVELVFSDASTQVVMAATNSTVLTTVTATITASKTIDHVRLYAQDAVGIVYYDFVTIYQGDFPIPNVRYGITPRFNSKNVIQGMPGMGGNFSQNLGSDLAEYTFGCDCTKGVWTRTLPNDEVIGEVFLDIIHNSVTQQWVWLTTPIETFKVELVDLQMPRLSNLNQMDWRLNFTLREYRDSDANCTHETYRTRWGLNET